MVCILKIFDIQPKYNHRIDISDFISVVREGKHRIALSFSLVEKQKFTVGSKMGVNRKVQPRNCRAIAPLTSNIPGPIGCPAISLIGLTDTG